MYLRTNVINGLLPHGVSTWTSRKAQYAKGLELSIIIYLPSLVISFASQGVNGFKQFWIEKPLAFRKLYHSTQRHTRWLTCLFVLYCHLLVKYRICICWGVNWHCLSLLQLVKSRCHL